MGRRAEGRHRLGSRSSEAPGPQPTLEPLLCSPWSSAGKGRRIKKRTGGQGCLTWFPRLGGRGESESGTCVLGALGWFLHQQLLTSPPLNPFPPPGMAVEAQERGLQGRGGGLAPDSGWHAGLEYLVKSKGNHDSSRTQGPQRRAEDADPSKGKGRAREQSRGSEPVHLPFLLCLQTRTGTSRPRWARRG